MIMSVVGVEQSRLHAHNANPDMSAGSFSSMGVFGDPIKGGIRHGLHDAVRS